MVREAFASEETVALAKQKACEILGVPEEKAEFEVLQYPEKKKVGVFGGKLAQIRAFLKRTPGQRSVDFIKEIFDLMGLTDFKVFLKKESREICEIKVDGDKDDLKYIVGKHGETLDALQYLTALICNEKNEESSKFCKVRIEAGHYREHRRKVLESLGKQVAKRALRDQEKISLEPMRSYERKILHTAVGRIVGAYSWSEGEGLDRHIVIAPKILAKRTLQFS